MRIIKPSFEIWDQEEGLEGIYKQIEFSTMNLIRLKKLLEY